MVLALAAVLGAATTGCHSLSLSRLSREPAAPENVFVASSESRARVHRVAVLPVSTASPSAAASDGREILGPTLFAELVKTRKFEVVAVEPAVCAIRTGRREWSGEEWLPHDFFDALREATGCDAVLFSQLTVFRGHAPLSVGWRMKLVDARSREVLWACDEVFDGGREAVAASAERYQAEHLRKLATNGEWIMRNSPRYFGQFAVARLLETLPAP